MVGLACSPALSPGTCHESLYGRQGEKEEEAERRKEGRAWQINQPLDSEKGRSLFRKKLAPVAFFFPLALTFFPRGWLWRPQEERLPD